MTITTEVMAARAARLAISLPAMLRKCMTLALCLAALIAAHFGGLVASIDNGLAAWRSQLVQRDASGSIVVVEIDSQSLDAAGQWPWPRDRFARAAENLRIAGAALVAFDVDFSTRSDTENDAAFARAISVDPSTIVLPTFIQAGGLGENTPLASLSGDALVASVNIPIDSDGRVRRYARGFDHRGHYHQSMAALLAGGQYGSSSTFAIDYGIRIDSIRRLSFNDVLNGDFDPEIVRGRHVLVGATALELGDEFATPVRPVIPGVYLHALAYENLVQGRALVQSTMLLSLLAALAVLALLWPRRAPIKATPWITRQAAVLVILVGLPIILQWFTPVSLNLAGALIAQLLCFGATVQRELKRRADDLVRQREDHLRHAALHDPETELPNRRAMIERLQQELARSDGRVVAIAIGVDRFAMLRAAIGYRHANQIIRRLAQRLTEHGNAEVYHLSTSIVGVVALARGEQELRSKNAGITKLLESAIELEGQDISIAIRYGFAFGGGHETNSEDLLEQATIALDQARIRNERFVRYDAQTFLDPKVQLALTSDIGRGLERGEFFLVYQPKARARDGAISGVEALIRWRHPDHGDIPPSRFVPAAEQTGAIDDLTRWVLRQVVSDQRLATADKLNGPISINISGRLLTNASFCAAAIDAMRDAGVSLCLEITETAIIEDPVAALAALAALREAGAKISIDDYGSGLSSLSYLKQIAADELKLDSSIIADIKTSARDRLILKSTINLAHSLGMSVVAEGVEDEHTRALLAGLGCDLIQGYLISRPLALADLLRHLHQSGYPNTADEPQSPPLQTASNAANRRII